MHIRCRACAAVSLLLPGPGHAREGCDRQHRPQRRMPHSQNRRPHHLCEVEVAVGQHGDGVAGAQAVGPRLHHKRVVDAHAAAGWRSGMGWAPQRAGCWVCARRAAQPLRSPRVAPSRQPRHHPSSAIVPTPIRGALFQSPSSPAPPPHAMRSTPLALSSLACFTKLGAWSLLRGAARGGRGGRGHVREAAAEGVRARPRLRCFGTAPARAAGCKEGGQHTASTRAAAAIAQPSITAAGPRAAAPAGGRERAGHGEEHHLLAGKQLVGLDVLHVHRLDDSAGDLGAWGSVWGVARGTGLGWGTVPVAVLPRVAP